MADVARVAGVSTMTVSRVVNGHASVSDATRARVEDAIEQLGYRPNAAARMLAGGPSATIGVIGVKSPYYGPASTLFGIEEAARDAELSVSFLAVRDVREEQILAAVEHLRAAKVDGMVIMAATLPESLPKVDRLAVDIPVVVLKGAPDRNPSTVAIDQTEGVGLAVRHLLELGHPTVFHVRGPGDWVEGEARASAWAEELRRAGIHPPDAPIGDWTSASGYQAGRALAQNDDVSAIFVANDQMALGVLLALHEAGRRIPDDVSVVGFDDIPEAAYFHPPLTTVRQDFAELGRRALHRLRSLMGGTASPGDNLIHPRLVQRESAAARPAR